MIPLSLYVHIPWCIRKCPYCDFNSHKIPDSMPEQAYVTALLDDLNQDLAMFPRRSLTSIFIGGGTPSLFSADAYDQLFQGLAKHFDLNEDMEITLEANPGTIDQQRFIEYRQLGINRLSLGIQSFNSTHLQRLGRIHDGTQAQRAIDCAREAGFNNINIDIMHGLPEQTVTEGLRDLEIAMQYQPEHLSWYQLTIEPNTLFYKQQPALPSDETLGELEQAGFDMLAANLFERYEISAFSRPGLESKHNLNYWMFGDYLGIGAGAHGKLTYNGVWRTRKHRQPNHYLDLKKPYLAERHEVMGNDLIVEFMLNATRLEKSIPNNLIQSTTGIPYIEIVDTLQKAAIKGLIELGPIEWKVTPFGRRFTNNLQEMFII